MLIMQKNRIYELEIMKFNITQISFIKKNFYKELSKGFVSIHTTLQQLFSYLFTQLYYLQNIFP